MGPTLTSLLDFAARRPHATECKRKFVRAVLFGPDRRIIAEAVNGPPAGHVCTGEVGRCGCEHAERKLLGRGPHFGLAVTHSPCLPCARLIVECKIQIVIYEIFAPHHPEALPYLHAASVLVMDRDDLTSEWS